MPLTILHISTRLILGGSQENTVLSCIGQARLGHRVHLAYGPIYGPEGSHLETIARFNAGLGATGGSAASAPGSAAAVHPITLHELPHLVREISPVKDFRCFHRDLKGLLRAVRPDVVHTHSSKAGILGRWAAWGAGGQETVGRTSRPPTGVEAREEADGTSAPPRTERTGRPAVIHTIHGPPFMPVEGSGAARLKVRLKNHLYTVAERFAARRCHTIVSVADAMTAQFLARGIGRPGQYITVRSGMDTAPFLTPRAGESRAEVRAGLGLGEGDFVIGTVARLAEHKGHDDLLDALGDDLRAHPHWKLLWVGDGWWRDRLLARVGSMGLRGQVITTGLVPNDRIPAMMRAMEVLVHPSYREGLPRTVPQALLAGVPVVASDVDGTPEVCLDPARVGEDRATGLLFPVGDARRLGEAVRWMAEHPEERAAMAQRGRAMCREQFSTEAMIDGLERVYAEALRRAGRN